MNKDFSYESNMVHNVVTEKSNNNIQVLLGNLYWQRKAAEAMASQKIAEAELETYKAANPDGHFFALSNNAKQALNNQTIYSFLTEVDKLLDSNSDGYVAKQVFSGDDR